MNLLTRRIFLIGGIAAAVIPSSAVAQTRRVTATRTHITWNQAYDAITTAGVCDKGALLLTAQWALETDRGRKMYRYNFAGIKGSGPEGIYCLLRTVEIKKGKRVRIYQRFRAYSVMQLGADDFVKVLKETFPRSYAAACEGNVRKYTRTLKEEGYYTSSPWTYESALRRHIELAKKNGDKVSH